MFINTTKYVYGMAKPTRWLYVLRQLRPFYEVGRVDMLRTLGLTYRGMEEFGVMMPVLELKCRYIKPALYDEEITVKVIMENMPGVRIHFKYELYNEQGDLINTVKRCGICGYED